MTSFNLTFNLTYSLPYVKFTNVTKTNVAMTTQVNITYINL